MQIKCLAIDDEPLALLQLKSLIEKTPFLQLVAACDGAIEAYNVLNQNEVDVIFVDINMPDLNGLDFVRSLANPPLVVFTTAYSQYAVEGFKVNAIDYLLKPFGMPEFVKSAEKVRRQYELMHQGQQELTPETPANGTLFVKCDYRTIRINVSDIKHVESMSEYLRIHLDNGEKLMTLMSMKRLDEMLPPKDFIRVHRCYIVNMNKVKEISKMRILIDADTYLPISDMYKDAVMTYINQRTLGGK